MENKFLIVYQLKKKKPKDRSDYYDKYEPPPEYNIPEEKLSELFTIKPPAFSSKEAKNVVDGALKDYAKDLKKLQYRVIKDWMSKAKAGVIDYFDIVRGIQVGDASRAHPNETEFLHSLLNKDKIMNRFKSYFGGKRGKKGRKL